MTRLALVVGCPRSGTTWLENMLLAHPAAAGLPTGETFAFLAARGLWAEVEARSELDAALRRFYDRVFGAALARAGADVYVEKTPAHAFYLREIVSLYPDARVVHVVRDGRDVVRSLLAYQHGTADAAHAARQWRDSLAAVAAASPAVPHLREVRYEDLRADPVGHVGALLRWIGCDADDDVAREVARRAGQRVQQPTPAGRELRTAQLQAIYRESGEALVAAGYLPAAELAAVRRTPSYRLRSLSARCRAGLRRRR